MPRVKYVARNFNKAAADVVLKAVEICIEYANQGFSLTLRQLYYQFVARGLIANKDSEYKRLGEIVNDARLAGLLDWSYIVDRTRNLRALSHWDKPEEIIASAAHQYRRDKWATQPYRPEVWIEKDALIGVIADVCEELDVPYFSCRGYTSQTEVWGAGQRMLGYLKAKQEPYVFHLGDHDPSGLDMTRDITDRLTLFIGGSPHLERLALNWTQVLGHAPPPNPAKITDSRAKKYIAQYGPDSWELDALEPSVIAGLVRDAIMRIRVEGPWAAASEIESNERADLSRAAERWPEIIERLDEE